VPDTRLRLNDPAVQPAFTLTPASIDFGTIALTSPTSTSLRVSNSGTGSLLISAVTLANTTQYSLSGVPSLPWNLNAGQFFDLTLHFAPAAAGNYPTTLTVTDNLARVVHTVNISGAAIDATITTFPWNTAFDTWPPPYWNLTGGTQNWVQYNVAATGNNVARAGLWLWPVPNNAVLVTPPLHPTTSNKLSFKWSHLYDATYPNDSLRVSYSTDRVNWTQLWLKGNTDLNSNDGAADQAPGSFVQVDIDLPTALNNTTFYVKFNAISGYGPDLFIDDVSVAPEPAISVTPTTLPFGEVAIGTGSSQNFTITNTGGYTLTGTILTSAGYTVAQARNGRERNSVAFSLTNGQSFVCAATLTPTAVQAYNSFIRISSNDPAHATTMVRVTGTGYLPAVIAVSVDSLSANLVTGNNANLSFIVQNTGSRALTYSINTSEVPGRMSGSRDVDWISCSPASGTVNTGLNQTIIVNLLSLNTTPGTHHGVISITSNDPLHPVKQVTVNLDTSLATPVIQADRTTGGVRISWIAVPGATSYRIYKSSPNPDNYDLLGTVTGISYIDPVTSLKAFYKVEAAYP